MKLLKQLQWRYSAKRMNGRVIPDEIIENILEAIRLAPTSMGLQPFQVTVVKDLKVRKEIFEEACQQPQILECSHLLIFNGWSDVTEEQVDNYLNRIAVTRNHGMEELSGFRKSILSFLSSRTKDQVSEWSARQIYLALGTAIDAAAMSEVDATPMEGFNAQKMDKLFQLKDRKLHSVVLLALGYRNEDKDIFARAPKVRRNSKEIFELI